ncbi:sulfatase [Flagellimonas oceanensis]|uniref:sulfatase family protein n=1 Tax=Flagellimonas oceanensis TaxID=2499163 RepID=UPI000F8D7305|nr:sulfatase [Allomuricauda oceanensis]
MSNISFFKIARSLGILGIVGLLFCVSCKGKPEAGPSSPPNILFIMSDDHTSQAWGIYGGPLKDYVRNENIKRLASEGAVLNNTFCTNSICVPSRGTILTGQYSHMNGVYTLTDALEPDSLNIAKVFQENGYHTAIIGKWHLKKQPSGFDYFNVLPGQGVYHDPILKTKENWQDSQEGGAKYQGFSTDVITDLSIQWMDTISKEKPFLLMTHFKATHEPFDYPERFKDLYGDEDIPEPQSLYDFGPETTGRSFEGQSLDNLALRWESASKGPWWCDYPELPFTVEGIDSIAARKKTYQKLVKDFMRSGAAVDENIGKLLDYLEQSGLAENTVVIYTADQGYFLGEHGFFDKRLIYEESLRMPFVIRYPKEIKGGQRIDDIVLNIDFASLFADYAGIDLPESFQGQSFRNNLKGETPKDWRKTMYYRYWTHEPIRPAHFGIRNERYKLALFYGRSLDVNLYQNENTEPAWEFYDLEKDPHENHNAFNDPQYAEVIAEMRQELLEQRENVGDTDADHPEVLEILNSHWN